MTNETYIDPVQLSDDLTTCLLAHMDAELLVEDIRRAMDKDAYNNILEYIAQNWDIDVSHCYTQD